MASKLELLRVRIAIVRGNQDGLEQLLDAKPHKINHNNKNIVRCKHRPLGKMVGQRVPGGLILTTTERMSKILSRELQKCREETLLAQHAADEYWGLSPMDREEAGRPLQNPSPGVQNTDKDGGKWIVDDRFLVMINHLIGQLEH